MQQASAFVLAGGKSSRMGRDKASLRLGGRTLLARAVETAKSAAKTIVLVGYSASLQSQASKLGVSIVEDGFIGHGPLAGIHAALKASLTDLNLVLAVDMPFITPALVEFLLQRAARTNAIVTVPQAAGHLHPLCAVYRRAFADVAEGALVDGKNKIDVLFSSVATEVISEDELAEAGFSASMFDNVNTPEDFARAEERLRSYS